MERYSAITALARRIREFLYPEHTVCWLCDRECMPEGEPVCRTCGGKLRACPAPVCPEPLDGLSCGLLYDEVLKKAMHRFKYARASYYARFFAARMEIPAAWRADCLVPVPLHPLRRLRRGYNQSELLAREVARRAGLPVEPRLLCRTRNTPSQTGLTAAGRKANLRGAFLADAAAAGRVVVLVDDVTTTRATLLDCARALKKAGALRVYAVTACSASE